VRKNGEEPDRRRRNEMSLHNREERGFRCRGAGGHNIRSSHVKAWLSKKEKFPERVFGGRGGLYGNIS